MSEKKFRELGLGERFTYHNTRFMKTAPYCRGTKNINAMSTNDLDKSEHLDDDIIVETPDADLKNN